MGVRMSDVFVIYGEPLTLGQASKKYNIKVTTLRARFKRNPNTDPSNLVYQKKPTYNREKLFEHQGESLTLKAWQVRHPHLTILTIRRRLKSNIKLAKPLTRKSTPNPNWSKPMPLYSKEGELSNRIKAYKQKGMTLEDIVFKIIHGDFSYMETR